MHSAVGCSPSLSGYYVLLIIPTWSKKDWFMIPQGPVYFDENRIRDTAELLVLQYRTTHTNGTPTSAEGNFSARLRLVPVAYYVEGSNESLEFIGGGRNSIWPSMLVLY